MNGRLRPVFWRRKNDAFGRRQNSFCRRPGRDLPAECRGRPGIEKAIQDGALFRRYRREETYFSCFDCGDRHAVPVYYAIADDRRDFVAGRENSGQVQRITGGQPEAAAGGYAFAHTAQTIDRFRKRKLFTCASGDESPAPDLPHRLHTPQHQEQFSPRGSR